MILQRYILRELAGSFAFAFCTVLSVCLIGTMFQVFRTFPGVGYEILVKALPLATGAMASWVMLVASCTSSTLVYARLSAENEITAMRACGIHLWSMASPAVLLGLLLVLAAYPLNEIIVPTTRHNRRMVFRDSIVYALREPPAGQQDFRIGSMRIVYTDYVDSRMVRPTVSEFKGGTLVRQCFAPAGQIVVLEKGQDVTIKIILTKPRIWMIGKYTTIYLRDGRKLEGLLNDKGDDWEIEPKDGQKSMVRKSEVERIQPPSEDAFSAENDLTIEVPTEDLDKLKRQPVDQPQGELWRRIWSTKDPKVRNPLLVIVHTRYAASLAPMLLVLVGMPIGVMVSRGSRLAGLGAALPPLLIYFITFFIFQGLGARNRVSPYLAAYLPDLILAAIAVVLLGINLRR